MANQLKDFMCVCLFLSSSSFNAVLCFSHNKPCIQDFFFFLFLSRQTAMKRSNSKAKSKDVVLTGERHFELPATSPIIPRKNQQREVFVKDFHTSMNELVFQQLGCSIKHSFSFFFFTSFFFFNMFLFLNSCLLPWRTHFGAEI